MFLMQVNSSAGLRDRMFKNTVGITRLNADNCKKTGVSRLSLLYNLNQLLSHHNVKEVSCGNGKLK